MSAPVISPQIRVLVVDDYAVVGCGLRFFLADAVALWKAEAYNLSEAEAFYLKT